MTTVEKYAYSSSFRTYVIIFSVVDMLISARLLYNALTSDKELFILVFILIPTIYYYFTKYVLFSISTSETGISYKGQDIAWNDIVNIEKKEINQNFSIVHLLYYFFAIPDEELIVEYSSNGKSGKIRLENKVENYSHFKSILFKKMEKIKPNLIKVLEHSL